jgi:hypothetical protein
MSKNQEQWIKIAEGGDGYNPYWDEEFAPVMQQIEHYIYAIDAYQLDLNWKEICDSVPVLRGVGGTYQKTSHGRSSRSVSNTGWIASCLMRYGRMECLASVDISLR